MIRFSPINLKRPVHLLHQDQPHELVRVGHLAEAELGVGAFQHRGGQAVRAADDEGDAGAAVGGQAVQLGCQLLGAPHGPVQG